MYVKIFDLKDKWKDSNTLNLKLIFWYCICVHVCLEATIRIVWSRVEQDCHKDDIFLVGKLFLAKQTQTMYHVSIQNVVWILI